MPVKGTFEISMRAEPPYDALEGVELGRASIDKRFAGPLEAISQVQMLSARTPTAGSAAYVAVERIRGSLAGREGSFVVIHTGLMTRGAPHLTITIVPDSGTGQLSGIAGSMAIEIVEGQHFYALDYSLPGG
jgi:hypothetical protein